MSFMDFLGGAGGGALSGLAMSGGNPYGALAGGVLGGGMGLLAGNARDHAASAQKASIDQAMALLRQSSQQQYQNRMQDLDKAMSFYGPARNALLAYGDPTPQLYGPGGTPPSPPPAAAPPPGMGTFMPPRRTSGPRVG